MILDQSSLFGENRLLLKMSIKMCAILCWMCWRWQCGVNVHHHDLAVIISLQTHPAKLVSSWCTSLTLWCEDLLLLLQQVQTSSAHSCPSDTHLLNISVQLRGWFSSWVLRLIQTSNKRILGNLLLKSISISIVSHMLTVYQSPVLYAWTMLHNHLVDFSPIYVCWCLHVSELLAGILSSSKTLNPLQLVHHSIAAPSLLLHLSRSDCLPDIGAKVVDSGWLTIFTDWISISSTSAASTDARPVAVSGTLRNTTFSIILSGSSSSALGSRYLDISPEWHNGPSQAG